MAKMNHALLYGNYEEVFNMLKDKQVARLIRAMLHYLNTGEDTPMKAEDAGYWHLLKDQLQRNMDKYEEVCEKNRKNSKKYWDSVKGRDCEEDDEEDEEEQEEAEEPTLFPLGNATVSAQDAQALYRLRDQKRSNLIL